MSVEPRNEALSNERESDGAAVEARFPFPIPYGWYSVAFSDEVARDVVERRRYFDRELVVFRDAEGSAHVLDAHCPHLGAHFGVGGRIEEGELVCPFHGWRFGGDGACRSIPYAKRIPPGARVRSYETREIAGLIWVWYHPEDRTPLFDPPVVPEWGAEGWLPDWRRYEWTIATHPQEVAENSVDWPHLKAVHGMDPPASPSVRFEGHEIIWQVVTRKNVATLDGADDAMSIDGRNPGLGASYVRYSGMLETVILMGMTPVDASTTHLRFGVLGFLGERSREELDAFLIPYADDQANAVTQDFPIWENKIFQARPRLCADDGEVTRFRDWADQFYVDALLESDSASDSGAGTAGDR